jgi:hypothetical protein
MVRIWCLVLCLITKHQCLCQLLCLITVYNYLCLCQAQLGLWEFLQISQVYHNLYHFADYLSTVKPNPHIPPFNIFFYILGHIYSNIGCNSNHLVWCVGTLKIYEYCPIRGITMRKSRLENV